MVKAAVLGAAGQIGQPLSLLLKMVNQSDSMSPAIWFQRLTIPRALWSPSSRFTTSSMLPELQSI